MKNNRSFVTWMKVICITLVAILLAAVFIGISTILKDESNLSGTDTQEFVTKANEPKNELVTLLVTGLVEDIGKNNLRVLDIDRDKYINIEKEKAVIIKDAYGNPLPINMIEKGDLLEIMYDADKERIVSIAKPKDSWVNTDIKSITIDRINKRFYIGQSMYTVAEDSLIWDGQNGKIMLEDVGEYDTLEVKGLGEKIYSIKVLERQAIIEIAKLPSYEGIVEIDTSRHINLQNINRPIPVKAGKHKVVIKMNAYKTIIKNIQVKAGEKILIIPENAEKAYTEIVVEVLNDVNSYTVEVDKVAYKPEDAIKVAQGSHHLKVSAEGYKSWVGDMLLSEPIIKLDITLESLDKEEVISNQDIPSTNATSEGSINILTTPVGAKVYIDNQYKGTTPYNTYLSKGEHAIVLQKEGYEPYTTILNKGEDNKRDHVYVLTPTGNSSFKSPLDGLLNNLLDKSLDSSLGNSLSGLGGN